MKRDKYSFTTFALTVLIIDAALLMVAGYPVFHLYGLPVFKGVSLAQIITTANILIGYWIIVRVIDRLNMEEFMKRVLGGMGVRLFIMLALIVVILLNKKINQNGFIIGLIISYIYKSVIEIFYINKKAQKRRI